MAQPTDVEIDGTIERRGRASPREIEQLVARQHLLRMFDEREEHIELGGTEIDQGIGR